MDKKGLFYAFKVTFTPEGPVGELLEDLETNAHREAEERLFKKYLKSEDDILGSIENPYVKDLPYKNYNIVGLTIKDGFLPAGATETRLMTENGFITLYIKPFWDKYLEENPGDIYILGWDDDEWREQLKFSQRESL